MEQQLAAVRLRLDNLLIKQSIFDRLEPHVAETKGTMPLTCDIWGVLRKRPGRPGVLPGLRGRLARRRFTGNRRYFPVTESSWPSGDDLTARLEAAPVF
jgi:hypothetical protein